MYAGLTAWHTLSGVDDNAVYLINAITVKEDCKHSSMCKQILMLMAWDHFLHSECVPGMAGNGFMFQRVDTNVQPFEDMFLQHIL